MTKSRLCITASLGVLLCRGRCGYAHTVAEYCIELCKNENCKFGPACKFMHSTETREEYLERRGLLKVIERMHYLETLPLSLRKKEEKETAQRLSPTSRTAYSIFLNSKRRMHETKELSHKIAKQCLTND